ncbi:MAG: hypothetical protein CMN72_12060 [Sphingomonas sp.]|nr:hypothetical protein [Sphingomonas sp.]
MTAPTNIFIEAHMFDHGFEGSGSFIAGLYRALLAAHPDRYALVVGGLHPERALAALGNPAQARAAPYRTDNRIARLAVDIPRIMREERVDFAHFQYFTPIVKQCAWIVTIHDVLFNDFPEFFPKNYRRMRNILFPLSARRADILTTVSRYSRDRIAHWYGIDPSRIAITPNGVEPADTPAGQAVAAGRPDGRYLICVSRFEPRKNQAAVLEAFVAQQLWERGISLVFVGARTLQSPAFDAVWAQAPEAARAAVRFLSGLSSQDLAALIAGAEVAVYPSLAEGFGLPPLEAIAHGVPCACARVTAMADFDFLEPFFFDPAQPDALGQVIARMLDAPQQARAQAAAARTRMLEEYAWARAAETLHREIDAHLRSRQ